MTAHSFLHPGTERAGSVDDAGEPRLAPIRMAFVHPDSLFWTYFRYNLLNAAIRQGVEFIDRPIYTLDDQTSEVDRLLLDRIDVLIIRVVATEDPTLVALLKRVLDQGVKLICVDNHPGGGLEVRYIIAENREGHARVMEFACQRLKGKGKIAHLQGDQRTGPGRDRREGVYSVLERYPGIEIVFEGELDWASTVPYGVQSVRLTRAALAAHPDLDAIIAPSDENALGAVDVLAEYGLTGKVLVTGFDGLPQALIAMDDGDVAATARQPLDRMAEMAFQAAMSMMASGVQETTTSTLDTDLVTHDSLPDAVFQALSIFPDVTSDLSLRGEELQTTATFLETLLDNLPSMVYVLDSTNLHYVRANRARTDWLSVSPEALLGRPAYFHYPADVAAGLEAADRQLIAEDRMSEALHQEFSSRDQSTRLVHTKKIPLHDIYGRPEYLLCISVDVTERKLAENALARHATELESANRTLKENQDRLVQTEKMASLGTLVAGVAHELNTPIGNGLMAASTFAEHTRAIARKYPAGLSRSALESYLAEASLGSDILVRNLRRAADLIASFKQIIIDQTNSSIRRFSLSTVLAETMLTLSPMIKKTPVEVVRNVPDHLVMESYPGPLEQVVMNLVSNALLHGFEGRKEGRVALSANYLSPGWIELTVEDNGSGIPPEHLKRVFDPFFTTRLGAGGSGLGLSIAHNIVNGLLGGRIEVSSKEGEGTRFCIALPLVAPRKAD